MNYKWSLIFFYGKEYNFSTTASGKLISIIYPTAVNLKNSSDISTSDEFLL